MTAERGAPVVPGDDWLEDFIPYRIYRVSSLMNMRVQGRLRACGVNLSQWRVLGVLRSDGRLSMTQIVERTVMEQPTISRVIAQLADVGLVSRSFSVEDSRIALISLSVKGQALFDEIAPGTIRNQRMALDGLTSAELKTLGRVLEKIEANIERDR